MIRKILLIGLAGSFGALARYGMAGLVQRFAGGDFPLGTFAVNVTGCFLAGMFWAASEGRLNISGEMRTIVLVGFMGAFTTFSTFMLETAHLARDAQWLHVGGNILMHNAVGAILLITGMAVGRML